MRVVEASQADSLTNIVAGATATRILLCLALAGLLARLILACLSYGTNDFRYYVMFAQTLVASGMEAALTSYDEFNLTPAMCAYSVIVLLLSDASGIAYPLLFKLPLIVADAATMVLLWKIWRHRNGVGHAALAAALFAWSFNSILITGYHCNTDPFYSFLALLAAYLAEQRNRHFAAGFALAAAINVKLIPVVLVPAFLASCRTRRQLVHFLTALSIGALPFVLMLLAYRGLFYEQVINYDSQPTNWGIGFFLRRASEIPALAGMADAALHGFRTWWKYLMLIIIALAAIDGRRRRWDHYHSAAVAASLFLILTPGFGMQYTVAAVPLLFAVSLPFATAYSLAAGTYLLTLYVRFSRGTFPWESFFPGIDPVGPAILGLVAWGVLVAFIVRYWALHRRLAEPPRVQSTPS